MLLSNFGQAVGWIFSLFMSPALFYLASPSLFRGMAQISKSHLWTLGIFSLLEVIFLATSWKFGYQYVPGPERTRLTIVISIVWLAGLWVLFLNAKKRQTYPAVFAYVFTFVLWLVGYAFPWFGEMP
jgi:hypothetical protein